MKCEKCGYELYYGAKFCNGCGADVPQEANDEVYNRTVWGYADKFLNLLKHHLTEKNPCFIQIFILCFPFTICVFQRKGF